MLPKTYGFVQLMTRALGQVAVRDPVDNPVFDLIRDICDAPPDWIAHMDLGFVHTRDLVCS